MSVQRISSFKSFTEVKNQQASIKMHEENKTKREQLLAKIGQTLEEEGITSFDELDEEKRTALVAKIFNEDRAEDIEAAKEGMKLLLAPLKEHQAKQRKNKEKVYKPRKVFLLGNHENRIDRAINNSPALEGLISTKDLGYEQDWEVSPFLHPVFINGVGFNHYWPVGAMGRPAGTAAAIISKLHMSCVAGHQQGKQVAYGKRADGKSICGIIAGSYYLHDESYMDKLSNRHWRGLLILNEVEDGHFDELFLSIEYLGRKYRQV